MVMQYFVSTLNAYGESYQTVSNELKYQYERHTVKIEREYMLELERLQKENE